MQRPHFDGLHRGKLRVAVLAGGPSAERDVSLKSGASVAGALQSLGHAVRIVDPAHEDLGQCLPGQVDVAFIALHGKFGEDGQVQQLLESAGVLYTGSGVAASRLAYSKSAAKERFAQCGVPTAPYVLIHETDSAQRLLQQVEELGFPLVVKPDTQGSSLGVTIVRGRDELSAALVRCFQYDAFGLLERAIDGTEWTVGLLDDLVLPPIRIATDRGFFDFVAKYEDDGTRYQFDSAATPAQLDCIARTARDACAAVGTCGLARVDLILDQFGTPQVLEVNTVPGLTDHSLVPKAAARLGWTMADLCQACLNAALARKESHAARRSVRDPS